MSYPLPDTSPEDVGLDRPTLDRLAGLIEGHIAEGRYPGGQIAVARYGRLAYARTFGLARTEPAPVAAGDDTLWLLFSNTKVITAAGIWRLVEDGLIRFADPVAKHLPGFERHGKDTITILELLTHQGGFPDADVPPEAWEDHELLREAVSDFALQWPPGSRVHYHGRAAHWVAAVLIEAVTGVDYRDFIRDRILAPIGLDNDVFVGLGADHQQRAADMHEPTEDGTATQLHPTMNTPAARAAGMPGSGGFATARGMVAFYQMMLQNGRLNGSRLFAPRTLEFVTRNFTGDRVDEGMGMPMHRGIGPHRRGLTETIRGLGTLASPSTYGHGGVGSSYCWADPDSGVSFAYLTNNRVDEPWHTERTDIVSSLAHAAIDY